jgi:histidine ammonia-lyase
MQEDHVSMAWGAARKLRRSVANLARILAVEVVCGVRALELREPLKPAPATAAARDCLREAVPGFGVDRWLSPELEAAAGLVSSGALVDRVEQEIGGLE